MSWSRCTPDLSRYVLLEILAFTLTAHCPATGMCCANPACACMRFDSSQTNKHQSSTVCDPQTDGLALPALLTATCTKMHGAFEMFKDVPSMLSAASSKNKLRAPTLGIYSYRQLQQLNCRRLSCMSIIQVAGVCWTSTKQLQPWLGA